MFIRLSLDGLKDELSWEVQNVGAWPLEDLHVSYPILRPLSHHPLILSANCFVFALQFDIKGRETIPQPTLRSSQSQNTSASEPSLASRRSSLWVTKPTMFSLTLPLIVQWPFLTLRRNFRLIILEYVSFSFPSPSNVPCHDVGHMLGVLHHLHRFLSKTALIPNGPISLQPTFMFCILIVPHRLHRAFQSLHQTLFLHSPPVAR